MAYINAVVLKDTEKKLQNSLCKTPDDQMKGRGRRFFLSLSDTDVFVKGDTIRNSVRDTKKLRTGSSPGPDGDAKAKVDRITQMGT